MYIEFTSSKPAVTATVVTVGQLSLFVYTYLSKQCLPLLDIGHIVSAIEDDNWR